jgi:ABC-type transport system involved in multi-copper enzyme maturation permease subunit
MTTTLRHLTTIAGITMLEGARKQIFHVLMLFAMTLIVISTLLGFLDHNVQIKIVKDLVCVAILVSSSLIAITLSVSGIPQEVEQRTAYPILAKPVKRWEFVVGKYLGTVGTVAIGMAIMTAAFSCILIAYSGHVGSGVFMVMPFLFLEAAIVAAIGILLSTVCTTPLAWFLTTVIFVVGAFKFQIHEFVVAKDHSFAGKAVEAVGYQLLPNLECFNFKDSIVHGIPVSPVYLLQTTLYGVVYTAAVLTLASLAFSRREL